MSKNPEYREMTKSGWQVKFGTWMLTIPFVMCFGAPIIISFFGLSTGQTAAAIGGRLIAAEVICLVTGIYAFGTDFGEGLIHVF